jgi:alpha-N-arabinofuranosidase
MVTTNVTGGGHFYVRAEDPAGEWSEPIWVDHPGIDPSLLFDQDGTVYFTCNGPGPLPTAIYQFPIDIETGKALEEPRKISEGTGGEHPEAPHLYNFDGTYYLMLAEGGTGYGHMVTIARADSPWGPFEWAPGNPILSHRSRWSPIHATGHADLVQAHDGSWWMVFLGIRPVTKAWPPGHNLGRETFLAPVVWKDGWPQVGLGGYVELEMESPTLPLQTPALASTRDDFDGPELALDWNFVRNPNPHSWSLAERPGWLALRGLKTGLEDVDTMAFLGRRQRQWEFEAGALLEFQPARPGQEAGLVVRMNEKSYYALHLCPDGDGRAVAVRGRIGDVSAELARQEIGDGPVVLSVRGDQQQYHLSAGNPGETPKRLISLDARHLSTEVAGGFTGVYLGLYAQGEDAQAFFDWFDYRGRETE